jgi:hypothetical protein
MYFNYVCVQRIFNRICSGFYVGIIEVSVNEDPSSVW